MEKDGKKSKFFILSLVIVIVLGLSVLLYKISNTQPAYANLDVFAQCLTDKGAVMYGAAWCPHCQSQKKEFGRSFSKINYVECPDDPKKCTDAGVTGYPTWIFSDGKRLEGEQTLENLANTAGCSLQK